MLIGDNTEGPTPHIMLQAPKECPEGKKSSSPDKSMPVGYPVLLLRLTEQVEFMYINT